MLSQEDSIIPGKYYVLGPENPKTRVFVLHGIYKGANSPITARIARSLSAQMPETEFVVPNGWVRLERNGEKVFSWSIKDPIDLARSVAPIALLGGLGLPVDFLLLHILGKKLYSERLQKFDKLKSEIVQTRGQLPTALYGFSEGGFFAAAELAYSPDIVATFCQSSFLLIDPQAAIDRLRLSAGSEKFMAFLLQEDDAILTHPALQMLMKRHDKFAGRLKGKGVSVETDRVPGRHTPGEESLARAAKFFRDKGLG